MVKYVGDRKFIECFTKLIIEFNDIYYNDNNDLTIPCNYNFMRKYEKNHEIPLFIEQGNLLLIDSQTCFKFANQLNIKCDGNTGKKASKYKYWEIRDTILLMYKICRHNMEDAMKKISAHDETFAYAENMIRTFKNENYK